MSQKKLFSDEDKRLIERVVRSHHTLDEPMDARRETIRRIGRLVINRVIEDLTRNVCEITPSIRRDAYNFLFSNAPLCKKFRELWFYAAELTDDCLPNLRQTLLQGRCPPTNFAEEVELYLSLPRAIKKRRTR